MIKYILNMVTDSAKLNNTVTVYVSTFDRNLVVQEVVPACRNELIQRCTDKLAKQQRYSVWRLLDYALNDCYGKGVGDLDFTLDGNGKWNCSNGVHFSLSHCNNVVAVAVCNHAVGVDLELVAKFNRHANSSDFAARILADSELLLLQNTSVENRAEALAEFWTRKESIFKRQGDKIFIPKAIDTTKIASHSRILTINKEKYALSVATDSNTALQIKEL